MFANYLPLLLSGLAFSVSAAETATAEQDLEPCINGAVSASGTFPTQAMEEQMNAYLAWSGKSGRPYYLFQVAADKLSAVYPQR